MPVFWVLTAMCDVVNDLDIKSLSPIKRANIQNDQY
jgi:hypothetical protein